MTTANARTRTPLRDTDAATRRRVDVHRVRVVLLVSERALARVEVKACQSKCGSRCLKAAAGAAGRGEREQTWVLVDGRHYTSRTHTCNPPCKRGA